MKYRIKRTASLIFLCIQLTAVALAHNNPCNIVDFGAVAARQTVNTKAIQKAISKCAGRGGERVVIPSFC